jgi:ribosomal protein L7/L12
MSTVTVTGWNNGFNKVQFNKLIRESGNCGLAEAKEMVDSLLEGQAFEIEISDADHKDFCTRAKELGAVLK